MGNKDEMSDDDKKPEVRRGGPATCPTGSCSECVGGPHHFNTAMIEMAEDEPEHPAAKLGIPAWFPCKHCDAWIEDLDEDD